MLLQLLTALVMLLFGVFSLVRCSQSSIKDNKLQLTTVPGCIFNAEPFHVKCYVDSFQDESLDSVQAKPVKEIDVGRKTTLRSSVSFCTDSLRLANSRGEKLVSAARSECNIHLGEGNHVIQPHLFGAIAIESKASNERLLEIPSIFSFNFIGHPSGSSLIEVEESFRHSFLTVASPGQSIRIHFKLANVSIASRGCYAQNEKYATLMQFTGLNKLEFSGVNFRGCAVNANHTNSRLSISNSTSIVFANCVFDRVAHGFYAVDFVQGNTDILFQDTDFRYNIGGAIRFGSSNMNIKFLRSSVKYSRSPSLLDLIAAGNDSFPSDNSDASGPKSLAWRQLVPQLNKVSKSELTATAAGVSHRTQSNHIREFGGTIFLGAGNDMISLIECHFHGNYAAEDSEGAGGLFHFGGEEVAGPIAEPGVGAPMGWNEYAESTKALLTADSSTSDSKTNPARMASPSLPAVQWLQGSIGESCDSVCGSVLSVCVSEGFWPETEAQFEALLATSIDLATCSDLSDLNTCEMSDCAEINVKGLYDDTYYATNPVEYNGICYYGEGYGQCSAVPDGASFCPCDRDLMGAVMVVAVKLNSESY